MSAFTGDQIAALRAPLAREHVKHREQSGRKVFYIEGWHAIAEANRIFGFDTWDRETVECRCVTERETKIGQQQADGWRVGYIAKVRITVRPNGGGGIVIREGTGYGSGIDRDLGAAHESAIKEAETDGMKRALMTFGNPFGLALYDKAQTDVAPPASTRPAAPPQRQPVNPNMERATEIKDRLKTAIENAKTPKLIEEIIKINSDDLDFLSKTYPKTYDQLMIFANGRTSEMYGSTG